MSAAADLYEVQVQLDVGARWSYPWATPGPDGSLVAGTSSCPPSPFVASGPSGPGGCPAVGTAIGPFGSFGFSPPVWVNNGSQVTSAWANAPMVTSVLETQDLLYGSAQFTIGFAAGTSVTVTWTGCCRLGTLMDGNGDGNWILTTIVAAGPGTTKSPKSGSLPVLTVSLGQPNVVWFPAQTFDGTTARFRLSASAESGLAAPSPSSGFSLAPNGTVSFTPSAAGLYAVQLTIDAYDAGGVWHDSAPLDMIFQAVEPPPNVLSLSLSAPNSSLTASVGALLQFAVQATLWPPLPTYLLSIASTPLPQGAQFVATCSSCTVSTAYVFSWTPTIASVSDVLCFQAVAASAPWADESPGMLCVTLTIQPLATRLVMGEPSTVPCGATVQLQALLTNALNGSPVPGRSISFEPLGVMALTNTSGWAACTWLLADNGTTVTASFAGVANEFGPSAATSSIAVLRSGVVGLASLALSQSIWAGFDVPVSVALVPQPSTLSAAGEAVAVVIRQGSSIVSAATILAGVGNIATGTLSGATLVAGPMTVLATYSGSTCFLANASDAVLSLTAIVDQRTNLSLVVLGDAVCGLPVEVVAIVVQIPSMEPLVNAGVVFAFANNTVSTTNASGAASTWFVPTAVAPALTLGATLFPAPDTSSTIQVNVVGLQTSFATLTADASFQNVPFGVQARLVSGPANQTAVVGAAVQFVLTSGGGALVDTRGAVTDLNGWAVPVVPFSIDAVGTYSLSVVYAGSACLDPAVGGPVLVDANSIQPAQLVLAPFVGVCGAPALLSAHLLGMPPSLAADQTSHISV